MHKLIIIDDEYEQVQGIKNFIPWERYDIEICDVAYNGRDGLELIKKHNPDIALIDIQMPFINGLTLIEEANKLNRNIQMIIMSGHDDFDYARKALQLKANNYLLKPCSAEEILQAVLRAKNICVEENNKKQMIQKYQSAFDEYLTMFKERLLISLLENKLRNPSTFFNDMKSYKINLSDATCCTAIFRLEEKDTLYTRITNEEFDCLIIKFSEELKKAGRYDYPFELIIKDGDLIMITTHDPFDFKYFTGLIRQVHNGLYDTFEYPVAVGIGQTVSSPLLAYRSYSQALAALENSYFLGGDKVAVYDDKIFEESFHFLYPFEEEKKLLQAIESGDSSQIQASVNNFFTNFDRYPINNNLIKKIGISLLNHIMMFCSEKNIDTVELQQLIFNSFDDIIKARSYDVLKSKIMKITEDIMKQIGVQAPINKYIQLALNYIHNNYSRDISLKTVADELSISTGYLSFLFKQEMKTNFIEYLNNYRIIAAKELLEDVRLKSYEIAYQIGFQDEKYFFKLFKRYTGLTPSQYRDSLSAFDSV